MSRSRLLLAGALLCILAAAGLEVVHLLLSVDWLWHPLGYCPGTGEQHVDCQSYNFWSGISGSNITLPFAATAFGLGWWHQHNCHIAHCPRLQWHVDPAHGHPVCFHHHPDDAPAPPPAASERT